MASWTVRLETVGVDRDAGEQLTAALVRLGDVVTRGDGRCVAELLVPGAEPGDALKAAMWVWRETLVEVGLPDLPVVSAEVAPIVRPARGRGRGQAQARRPA